MENLVKRFPDVGVKIFKNLDQKGLDRIIVASKVIAKFLQNEKLNWIRIIKIYNEKFQGHEESWRQVVIKIPFNTVKKLAFAVQQFFKINSFNTHMAPLHIVVKNGSLDLFEYTMSKTSIKNPADKNGWTPLHYGNSLMPFLIGKCKNL